MSPDPNTVQSGRFEAVPMSLYLEDRREDRRALAGISEQLGAIRRELDRDDGQEVAERAATKVRSQMIRDVVLVLLATSLTATASHFL